MPAAAFAKNVILRLRDRALEESNRSMWKNFMTSIGLLTIAMLSALYSSSVARDGRIVAAGLSALIALGIAIWVGIRFVPRLAANVEWDWLPFLSQYHVTREGWIYFGGLVVVIFAAINTNNNLLYMVLSALMAVLLLSGFLSGVNFRWLRIDLRIPPHCFAGESFPISLQIRNQKTIFPSFSLSVEQIDKDSFLFKSFYLACVRAQSQTFQAGDAMFRFRGRYEIKKVRILSRYPFGFFLKSKEYDAEAECICYPEIIPQDQLDFASTDIMGSNRRFERGLGNDLYMIRDYLPSDSARHVHWKASAKTATLKTREFAAEDNRRVSVYLDRFGNVAQAQDFEQLVSRAASIVFHLIRGGIDVALITDEWSSGFGGSDPHLHRILSHLAVIQRAANAAAPEVDSRDGTMVISLRTA
jgi:uncharacterized protein (DUF58 family)